MTTIRALSCPALAVCAFFYTGAVQARDSYDCADYGHVAPEGQWDLTEEQEAQLYKDLHAAFPNWEEFMVRSCGVIDSGKQMVLVGALHVVKDYAMCEDDANFGVLYDPQTRKFGDVAPHQKLCWHGDKIPRPQP